MFKQPEFPFFSRNTSRIYLDSAATSLKPEMVIKALTEWYENPASIHRAIYSRAEKGTASFEAVRDQVQQLIQAEDRSEIVFTKNATEASNSAAMSLWANLLHEGDEIVTTQLEHHSHILPLQQLAERKKLTIKIIPVDERGVLITHNIADIITTRTKLVAITLDSNAISGGIDPLPIIKRAHEVGAYISLDAAQAIVHKDLSVKDLKPDILFFSAHKMLGPEGMGILYIRKSLHKNITPTFVGGSMVASALEKNSWRPMPYVLEAGTPVAGAVIAFGAALAYRKTISLSALQVHEKELCAYVWDELSKLPEITLYGKNPKELEYAHLLSFSVDGIHSHDVAAFLDSKGIEVRAGNHCAEPLHAALGIAGTVRISVYGYTQMDDVKKFVLAIQELINTIK